MKDHTDQLRIDRLAAPGTLVECIPVAPRHDSRRTGASGTHPTPRALLLQQTAWIVTLVLACTGHLAAQDAEPEGQVAPPAPATVAELIAASDRNLVDQLKGYIESHPDAADLEQAYLVLFEKAIENDWFLDHEEIARRYLEASPDGAVGPLARIVAVMARADAGQFEEALRDYRELMKGLNLPEQEEFAANFADSLAGKAVSKGEIAVARAVFEELGRQFANSPTLLQRIDDELARLDRIGKTAPNLIVRDVQGRNFRLDDLRGQYVLVDFWATWSTPSLADLPALKEAYDRFHDRGFEIVSISLDDSPRPLVDFLGTRDLPWRHIHNATSGGDPVASFGITSIPASFLIAPDGTIERLDPRPADVAQLLETKLGTNR